jgi:hypothetical protein
MVASRVSRRAALAAAAGWVAAPVAPVRTDAESWRRDTEDAPLPAPGGRGRGDGAERVFLLYRDLARFLRDPSPDRAAALRRALGPRLGPAAAAYGEGLEEYLLEQCAGLSPADADWARPADAADVAGQVREGLARARLLLAARESPAVFLIFSRRFDGRTDGRSIFFGVDRFGLDRLTDSVGLLTAHEYNHVVRARAASFATLLGGVVAEGLATACSELAEPGRPLHDYLLYSPAQLAWFTPARLARLWADLAAHPASTDAGRRRAYLDGATRGPFGAPPRGGYYLGYLLVRAHLRQGVPLARLTRMSSEEIWLGSGYAP